MSAEMTELLPLVAILAVVGGFAGVLAGLLGVGGGIVLVPAFYYVFSALGHDSPWLMQICLATSLATIIVTSARSVLGHGRKGAVDWEVLRTWAPGIALGAIFGVLAVAALRTPALQAIFGVLGMLIGLWMGFGRIEHKIADEMPKGLMVLHGKPIHKAVATAAGFGGLIALPSVIGFLFVEIPPEARPPFTIGAVNIAAFAIVVTMTLFTAPLGVKLAHRLDPKPLKRVFAVFLILVAGNMLRKSLGL